MQKNISITIGGIVFHIEELAYAKLKEYLDAVKTRFASQAEGDEIVADIENRIAERFLSSLEGRERIVKGKDVEELILAMGDPEQFEADNDATADGAIASGRKLYRNPDDALIAGVASGLAAYFGIEPVVVRLLFLLTLLFGGAGIVLYIILLVIVPEAKTPTEKLRMRGKAVTLDSVDRVIRDSVNTIKNETSRNSALRSSMRTLGETTRLVIQKLARFLGIVLGLIVTVVSFAAILATSIFLMLGLTRGYAPYLQFPLAEAAGTPLFVLALLAGYLVLIIPLFLILRLGAGLVSRRTLIRARFGWPLLAIWFIAVIAFASAGFHIGVRYQNFISSDPDYQLTTRSYDLKDFSKVEVQDGLQMVLEEGKNFSVTVEGRRGDIERLGLKVEDGALIAERGSITNQLCIFCISRQVKIRVQAPQFTGAKIKNASRLSAEILHSPTFSVDLTNASFADIGFGTSTTAINASLANASRIDFEGYSKHLELSLKNDSYAAAEDLSTDSVNILSENSSRARLNVSSTLSGALSNDSRVTYIGEPAVQVTTKNGSRIERQAEESLYID